MDSITNTTLISLCTSDHTAASHLVRGTILAFFKIEIPVSPPVKLECSIEKSLLSSDVSALILLHWIERVEVNSVHLMQLTAGCMVRKSPISEPLPIMQLIRPFGKPAK